MSAESTLPELAVLSTKLGQLIRSDELKIAGKLLATARGHLQQLAEKEPVFYIRYQHIAQLRGKLVEPSGDDFDSKKLLVNLLDEEKELREVVSKHPHEQSRHAHTLLKSAAAIVLVYCQDLESDAPLDF